MFQLAFSARAASRRSGATRCGSPLYSLSYFFIILLGFGALLAGTQPPDGNLNAVLLQFVADRYPALGDRPARRRRRAAGAGAGLDPAAVGGLDLRPQRGAAAEARPGRCRGALVSRLAAGRFAGIAVWLTLTSNKSLVDIGLAAYAAIGMLAPGVFLGFLWTRAPGHRRVRRPGGELCRALSRPPAAALARQWLPGGTGRPGGDAAEHHRGHARQPAGPCASRGDRLIDSAHFAARFTPDTRSASPPPPRPRRAHAVARCPTMLPFRTLHGGSVMVRSVPRPAVPVVTAVSLALLASFAAPAASAQSASSSQAAPFAAFDLLRRRDRQGGEQILRHRRQGTRQSAAEGAEGEETSRSPIIPWRGRWRDRRGPTLPGANYTFKGGGARKVYLLAGPVGRLRHRRQRGQVFALVYDLPNEQALFRRHPSVDGSLYFVGGFGVNHVQRDKTVIAPVRFRPRLAPGTSTSAT